MAAGITILQNDDSCGVMSCHPLTKLKPVVAAPAAVQACTRGESLRCAFGSLHVAFMICAVSCSGMH